jgi:hypothetical protein
MDGVEGGGNLLVVALASRLVYIYDLRQMDAPVQERESSLKFMTRSLACMVDGQGASVFCLLTSFNDGLTILCFEFLIWQGMQQLQPKAG